MKQNFLKLLFYKNLGLISFDQNFQIREISPLAENILKKLYFENTPRSLLDFFPEFFGNESSVLKVLKGNLPEFRLDFVNKPDKDGNVLFLNLLVLPAENASGILLLEDVTEPARLKQEVNQQRYELLLYQRSGDFRRKFVGDSIIGTSPSIQQIKTTIHKLGTVPAATVLLMGESGTGKNLVARVIHYSSMPPDSPFIEINCAALPETLLESELFGYEKGAFTHAISSRVGLIEEAEGGTLFLDEIGELSLNLQAKLLSVLETKKFRRLGNNALIEIKTRIITATNKNLQQEIKQKNFRQDLFYRLNIVSLTLPPLRELQEDILPIARHFLNVFNLEFKKKVKGFTPAAERELVAYSWPGNVRELSNCLERAMIFAEGERIDKSDLLLPNVSHEISIGGFEIPPGGIHLEEVEKQLILSALKNTRNNKSKAARLLGLSRDTLRYRMEKHGIE